MKNAEQRELFKGGVKLDKNRPDLPKRRWLKFDHFWKSPVSKTEKEHVCVRCQNIIPAESSAEITVDFDGVRPTADDFKKIQYWHLPGECPRQPITDEPSL